MADYWSNNGYPTSYARSSDFNLLHYTPITSKKMPKRWFPDVYPKYIRPSSPTIDRSSSSPPLRRRSSDRWISSSQHPDGLSPGAGETRTSLHRGSPEENEGDCWTDSILDPPSDVGPEALVMTSPHKDPEPPSHVSTEALKEEIQELQMQQEEMGREIETLHRRLQLCQDDNRKLRMRLIRMGRQMIQEGQSFQEHGL